MVTIFHSSEIFDSTHHVFDPLPEADIDLLPRVCSSSVSRPHLKLAGYKVEILCQARACPTPSSPSSGWAEIFDVLDVERSDLRARGDGR